MHKTHDILITVDVEDWFQVENLRSRIRHQQWDSFELRVENNIRRLLALFAQHGVVATFFVLGWLAERCPAMVRRISAAGHEVASHGYGHGLCYELPSPALREDLHRSKALLEDITGQAIYGYRAPNFSLTSELATLLAELGYTYDSSYNSFSLHDRYGKLDATWQPATNGCFVATSGLIELPVSNIRLGPWTVPWGGGGYFRLWPGSLFRWGVSRILKRHGFYLFYVHPWEIDPGQPRVTGLRRFDRFRHYVNLERTELKLHRFFSAFRSANFLRCYNKAKAANHEEHEGHEEGNFI